MNTGDIHIMITVDQTKHVKRRKTVLQVLFDDLNAFKPWI